MAKLKVVNTREHDITLHTPKAQVTVPAAVENPLDRTKMIHGEAEMDQDHLDALKNNVVVKHYFDEGWLRVKKEAKEQPKKD